jgi:L-fucose mutarotase/ribose pyranase (RbsD/FucU family)
MNGQVPQHGWESVITDRLSAMGHRNWIVVADSAYPKQVAAGIETVPTGADHFHLLKTVLDSISEAGHVRPIVHLDAELQYVSEDDAPGIDAFREELEQHLVGQEIQSRSHEEIIGELDEAGKSFHVLLLKSKLTLPYTTVFLQLDCGYWSNEAEQNLRRSIETAR